MERSAAPATPAPRGQEKGETSVGGSNYPLGKENEWERKSRVPDPASAADLGQSPPCLGLSFPTHRPKLRVSIAALAAFSWSFPELGGMPFSAGSSFPRPRAARSRAETPLSYSSALSARRERPLGDRPRGCSAPPGWAVAGLLPGLARARLAPSCRPRCAADPGDTLSSLRCRPRPRGKRPAGVPAVLRMEAAGARAGLQRSPPAQSAQLGAQALPGRASPAATLPVPAVTTPNLHPLASFSPGWALGSRCLRGWADSAQRKPTRWGRSAPSPAHADGRLWCRSGWLPHPHGGTTGPDPELQEGWRSAVWVRAEASPPAAQPQHGVPALMQAM